jgi:hypothetical protein
MHQTLTRGALMAVLGLAMTAPGAGCQSASREIAAVDTVPDFRLNWMRDATPFNACGVHVATDGRQTSPPESRRPGAGAGPIRRTV